MLPTPVHIQLDTADPRARLWAGIRFFMGEKAKWLPAYDEVSMWLADNNSRGLICIGTCGLGKSLICTKILPQLLSYHFKLDAKVVTAVEMNQHIDELLAYCGQNRVIIIDDLGTEAVETVTFGNRRKPFCELTDAAERTGTMLIITTNLRTTRDTDLRRNYPSIETRYGEPTIDRLRAITKVIVFKGQSLR